MGKKKQTRKKNGTKESFFVGLRNSLTASYLNGRVLPSGYRSLTTGSKTVTLKRPKVVKRKPEPTRQIHLVA